MISRGVEDSYALGERIGGRLAAGDFIALRGTLGVGKTHLVKGIAAGYLGSSAGVRSPSFTVLNVYEGAGRRIHHLDLYRLRDIDDLESTGYWEFVEDEDVVVIVEWLEQIAGAAPHRYAEISLEYVSGEAEIGGECNREISLGHCNDGDLEARLKEVFGG